MKAVGVRELKAQLSQYLREVGAGEIVLVTDRGRVVAELRAPGLPGRQESPVERRLRALADRMPLTIGTPHDPSIYRVSPVRAAPGTAQAMLDEERAE
jgi:antitoxin (DNA-binding transcriptional repressor) of toxin-antitoxin stability system